MNLNKHLEAFVKLGQFLRAFTAESPEFTTEEERYSELLNQGISTALIHNGWFTKADIHFSLQQWGQALQNVEINQWLTAYNLKPETPKTVAIIMAGNIPLVGFHDFLCVLLSGHNALIKQSSKDRHLLPCLLTILTQIEPEFKDKVQFTTEKLENFDAVIATGSNNTARYFDYYFSNKPNIIRRNRNSVAILTGEESAEELKSLGEDIFRYFGLGCRSVSKLFVPKDYDFTPFFEAMFDWNPIINHHKYANNYDYNKAVYLMSEFKLFENGFLVLKEEESYASPIACLFYEFYEDRTALEEKLLTDAEHIQCIVSQPNDNTHLNFGQTQHPKLSDYADGVDTLAFLEKL